MSATRALATRFHALACDVDDAVAAITEPPRTDELLHLVATSQHLSISLRRLEALLDEIDPEILDSIGVR